MENKVEPRILSGFLELLPNEQILFNQMMDKIKASYEKFGFLPLDTPVIELSEVLLAKAGGETEKQIYRFSKGDTDLSLRFDLTVPLARYVAMNYNSLAFPFRRYQIGKVYRGEKPQKGRFREFYQCDIDIIGDTNLSIINDAEIPSVIYNTFKELGFGEFTICINNRKILNGLYEELNFKDLAKDIMRIIDKIDKAGADAVKAELRELGLKDDEIEKIINFISIDEDVEETILALKNLNFKNELFLEGLSELETVTKYIKLFGVPKEYFKIDLKIARGLDYYTGTVYETFLNGYRQLGSVCSGGRYENLAEYYTDKKLPGVGISIGFSRLFYKLNEMQLIKSGNKSISQVLIIPMMEDLSKTAEVATRLRQAGISTEVYIEPKKAKAKFAYANKLNIPYVIAIGEEEVESGLLTLKNMETGEQIKENIERIIETLMRK